jgi:hypothetical protein
MATLLSVMDSWFRRVLDVIDLQTGSAVADRLPDESDTWSYSNALREEWQSHPRRNFYVCRSALCDGVRFGAGDVLGRPPETGPSGRIVGISKTWRGPFHKRVVEQ